METHRLILMAYIFGILVSIGLLFAALATPSWAVRDMGKVDRDDYVQIRYGLFQKCIWTKVNNSLECFDSWQNAPIWRRACVGIISATIIISVVAVIWSIIFFFNIQPLKGDCHCSLLSHPVKSCARSTLPISIAAVLAFLCLIIMMIILGVSTAQYTYYNDLSMYLAVGALTLLFVCTSLGAGVVYFTPTDRNAVATVPVSV